MDLFVVGIQRFVLGLSKKVLIANPLGSVADRNVCRCQLGSI